MSVDWNTLCRSAFPDLVRFLHRKVWGAQWVRTVLPRKRQLTLPGSETEGRTSRIGEPERELVEREIARAPLSPEELARVLEAVGRRP